MSTEDSTGAPLPEADWLAGAGAQAWRATSVQSWPAENAARYTTALYTADQMRSYAAAEVARERGRWQADAERYRWMRENALTGSIGFGDCWIAAEDPPDSWDAQIDSAAIRSQP